MGPFEGIRVIDFSQVLSGPFATAQLALLGAEVIKVERPGTGEQGRQMMGPSPAWAEKGLSPLFVSVNAGKRSLTLDLKSREAADIVHRLVATADVLIENFRPGTMERMGFGYPALSTRNRRLVYCSLSGFGQDGPKAAAPAYDHVIQAASGMMSITGFPETGPTKAGFPVADMATGLAAAFAIASALFRRERSGKGQYLDVAMLDTAFALLAPHLSNFVNDGVVPGLVGNGSVPYARTSTVYRTRDGDLHVSIPTQAQFEALCRVLGCPGLARDPRFATPVARYAEGEALYDDLARIFMTDGAAAWEARLAEAGVPAARIASVPEALADPQVRHRALLSKVHDDAMARAVCVPAAVFKGDGTRPAATAAPPTAGRDTQAVLLELGFSAEEIAGLRARKAV